MNWSFKGMSDAGRPGLHRLRGFMCHLSDSCLDEQQDGDGRLSQASQGDG